MLEDEDYFEVLEKHSDETYEADAESSRRIMALLLQSIPKKSPLMNGLIVLKNNGMKAYREWHLKFAGATAMRVMNLWTKITSIERGHGETITNYIDLPPGDGAHGAPQPQGAGGKDDDGGTGHAPRRQARV